MQCDEADEQRLAEPPQFGRQRSLFEAREQYRLQMETEHGHVLNPITGEELDIMKQCVNLQLDTGNNREVGDVEAYKEVISDFTEILPQGMVGWAIVDSTGKYVKGTVGRVNAESDKAVNYDFHYSKTVIDNGRKVEKLFVLKDCSRMQIKTRQLLVKGDPAGGKTTFAKQLLIWIMRHEEAQFVVPVMIRTVDLVRNKDFFVEGCDMVDQYLMMQYQEDGRYDLFRQARSKGRLLLILDGFDEAGALESRLAREINEILNNEIFVVLTSRDMATTFKDRAFDRFRVVRVMPLSQPQQQQVIEKHLSDERRVASFCKQLDLNPALNQMATNPLLLNVMLAVFSCVGLDDEVGLNRSRVYSMALDGMLAKVELVKGVDAAGGRSVVSDKALRTVLKQVAYRAHTSNNGKGIRDFKLDLIQTAIETSGVGEDFTLMHWKQLEDVIKRGRLPVLTWFVDAGEDTFRFAHLTFQEFLCAEQCLEESLKDDKFIDHWQQLVCPRSPREIIERGWWQQSIQMYCDLVFNTSARTSSGKDLAVALADSFLRLDERATGLQFKDGVSDANILTLTSLLQNNTFLTRLELAPQITSSGISTLQTLSVGSLQCLCLANNRIGPEGCKSIAAFMRCSGAPLEQLDLVDNVICQGSLKPDAPPKSMRNRKGCYSSHFEDLSGLSALLEAARSHPTLYSLDLRANFLSLEAGRMLAQVVFENENLDTVCGVEVDKIRERSVNEIVFKCVARMIDRYGDRPADPYLSSGGVEFLLEVLLHYPDFLPDLTHLCLAHQAMASDSAGVVELFEKLATVVGRAKKLKSLNIAGFWDCGAAAGQVLGKAISAHPELKKVWVGMSSLDIEAIRCNRGGTLDLERSNIRDCGAGILSQCLPPCVQTLSIKGCGVGASGYKMLSQCPNLLVINGMSLTNFTQECSTLDLSQGQALTTAAVACVLSRTSMTPNLTCLNLAGSNLTSKSHIHVLTPVLGSGPMCDGGCDCTSLEGTNVYWNCAECDVDICSTCCMSQCPMVTLGETLQRLEQLETLNIANCAFEGGRFGPVRSANDVEGYIVMGKALSNHQKLAELDVSRNHFKGDGFPHLAKYIALMPALSRVKLGQQTIDFNRWLTASSIVTDSTLIAAEVLLLSRTVARNRNLRHLDLSESSKHLSGKVVEALVESLDCGSGSGDGGSRNHVALETLRLDGLEFPLASLQAGTMSVLDFSTEAKKNCAVLAPLFVLALNLGTSLDEVNFCNLEFGSVTDSVVGATLSLAQGSLRRCNRIDLQPQLDVEVLNIQSCPVMPHGICVMAATTVLQGNLVELNVSDCGMDAASLGSLLNAMQQRQTVKKLDVSCQPLKKAGVLELAKFLVADTKLEVLRARKIGTTSAKSDEMLRFAQSLGTNVTLATLDFRENQLHEMVSSQLKRTMEEKRKMLPFPMESKVCFLLCNQRMPFHRRLPVVTQVAAHDAYAGPLLLIFKFCGQVRELLLDQEYSGHPGGMDLDEMREQLRNYLVAEEGVSEDSRELAAFLEWDCGDIRSARRAMIRFGLLDHDQNGVEEASASSDSNAGGTSFRSDDENSDF